jgi:methionyl-tRNA synthetase
VRQVAILVQPVMPTAAARLLDLVAVPKEARSFAALGEAGRLTPGTKLPPAEPVFPRYAEKDAAAAG